ncbi:membrane lipoprotein lipid attachment site-containing protein [Neobacillus sp. 114]|uniref:membrane lipoprotein lipid attachment site-containing protein n=1 Tax=Neobacillus sp. 114 TaxID=3048535 RepID=UPI0024C36660|nr:membrane lipoprotein lipid attachment site-containing protein [Neobacillus sp. 114]
MKKVISLFVAAALLSGCTKYENGKPVNQEEKPKVEQKQKKAAAPKEEPKKELTLEEKITKDIEKKLGKQTNTKKKRIVDLTANDNAGTEVEGDKIILLTLAGDENLSNKMTIKGMLMDSSKAFQEVFKNKDASEVTLFWQFPMVDSYGKSKEENVIKISLTRETFDKVEWQNFDYNNFEKIADQYWIHPALANELNK